MIDRFLANSASEGFAEACALADACAALATGFVKAGTASLAALVVTAGGLATVAAAALEVVLDDLAEGPVDDPEPPRTEFATRSDDVCEPESACADAGDVSANPIVAANNPAISHMYRPNSRRCSTRATPAATSVTRSPPWRLAIPQN